jgi:hypothetical protein
MEQLSTRRQFLEGKPVWLEAIRGYLEVCRSTGSQSSATRLSRIHEKLRQDSRN